MLSREQRQEIVRKLIADRKAKDAAALLVSNENQESKEGRVQALLKERHLRRLQSALGSQTSVLQGNPPCLSSQLSYDELLSPGSTISLSSQQNKQGNAGPVHCWAHERTPCPDHKVIPPPSNSQQQPRGPGLKSKQGLLEADQLWSKRRLLASSSDDEDEEDNDYEDLYDRAGTPPALSTSSSSSSSPSFHLDRYPSLQSLHQPLHCESPRARSMPSSPCAKPTSPNRHSLQAALARHADKQGKECTHQPRINRSKSTSRAYPKSREQRIQELAQPRVEYWAHNARIKQQLEEEQLKCVTFKPKVGRGPEQRLRHSWAPVSDRLHVHHELKARERHRRQEELEEEGLRECTFKPRTNSSQHLDLQRYVPIHRRVGELLRSKNERLNQIQQVAEQEQVDLTFAPKISARSADLAERRRSKLRQMAAESGSSSGAPRLRRSASPAHGPDPQCTFSPEINHIRTDQILARSDAPQQFLERQRYYDRLAKEKKRLLQEALHDPQCQFSPNLCPPRSSSVPRTSSSSSEGFLDRVERMAYKDREKAAASRAAAAEQYYSQYTFKPQINRKSQVLAKGHTVDELYLNDRGRQKKAHVAEVEEAKQLRECTFKPTLISKPLQRGNQDSCEDVVQRLSKVEVRRQKKVHEAAHMKDYDELKECTFTPQLCQPVPGPKGPVVVRGLGRHMELKEMARKQQEAKEKVEEKVFFKNPKGSKTLFTVPEPFKLGGGQRVDDLRVTRAEQTASMNRLEECTFKPRTNVSEKQQLIKRILESDLGETTDQ